MSAKHGEPGHVRHETACVGCLTESLAATELRRDKRQLYWFSEPYNDEEAAEVARLLVEERARNDAKKAAEAAKVCPYWSDGEHCFGDREYEDGEGYRVYPKQKECRCGATVKPKEGR